ncbi:hypothetical protein [Dinghuibacter silviterrae]|uniref:PepSY-like beta-lactamase-inhibitor n=1 Tax=Dinghuibacter silviterrae TaxID=1539049 RepID=A0A4R8DQ23_9BACT|nr:hypothetical protein [Dinghuibacter silviterrae]TDW99865.1 hypothetical protein EDB95_0879 [Dinghuibacter silviterrae]
MNFIIPAQKIAVSLLLSATLTTYALASEAPVRDVNEKAKKAFVRTFPNAEAINWTESKDGDTYTAYFRMYDVKTVANFDRDGQIISVIRYYGEDRLPLTVLSLLKTRYAGKNIAGVTELSKNQNEDVAYYIKLQDDAHWYTVKIIGNDMEETERLDKQQ